MWSLARILGGVIVLLSLITPAAAEPRGGYEQMFKPLRELLAPCLETADRCIAEGKGQSVCRAEAEQCFKALEEQIKEDVIRELEKEDPSARKTMAAMDAHQACVSKIQDCLAETKNISRCVEHAPRCQTNAPKESAQACCPSICIAAYQARVKQGAEAVEAYADIFIKNPSCFPGLPANPSP